MLANSITLYPLLLDLDCKLLISKSSSAFITCDNPVVFYNQYFSYRRNHNNTGFAAKGLQAFLPISPKHVLMFYDPLVYQVGSPKSEVFEVQLDEDLTAINRLQLVSAYENVYHNRSAVIREFYLSKFYREDSSASNVSIVNKQRTASGCNELVKFSPREIRTNLNLSFVSVHRKAIEWLKKFQQLRSQPVAVPRNPTIIKMHDEFKELVRAGKRDQLGFPQFIEEKLNQIKRH